VKEDESAAHKVRGYKLFWLLIPSRYGMVNRTGSRHPPPRAILDSGRIATMELSHGRTLYRKTHRYACELSSWIYHVINQLITMFARSSILTVLDGDHVRTS